MLHHEALLQLTHDRQHERLRDAEAERLARQTARSPAAPPAVDAGRRTRAAPAPRRHPEPWRLRASPEDGEAARGGAASVLYLLGMERRLRIAAVVLVLAWFFVPLLRSSIPAWIPFLAFAALEVQFLVAGWREREAPRGKRGRAPLPEDVEEFGGPEWLEPVLVEAEGHQVWVPADIERGPRVVRPRRSLLPRLEGVLVLAGLVLLLILLPESGWRGLDEKDQRRTEARLSRRGGADRRPRRANPLRRPGRGGRDRPARGRRRRGRGHERLPDAGDLLPALPARVQGRRGRVQPDRARDRRARARGVAPPRRGRRGRDQLLRVPERGRAGRAARPLARDGGADDAAAAGGEPAPGEVGARLPRATGVPERRRARPRAGHEPFPLIRSPRRMTEHVPITIGQQHRPPHPGPSPGRSRWSSR